jgi:hypothetical protein
MRKEIQINVTITWNFVSSEFVKVDEDSGRLLKVQWTSVSRHLDIGHTGLNFGC